MSKQWNDLVALARAIDEAIAGGATVETEQARRLARGVLAVEAPPSKRKKVQAAPPERRGRSTVH